MCVCRPGDMQVRVCVSVVVTDGVCRFLVQLSVC